ncbi:unnamed protein product [Clonostachys byssicola]|uniref:Major facilitator superfamily (MFS) profile domain-containing protein n=1 Tax=Clonostachys byssicola TaxID=160290 RepID=A0A9N9UJS8_9HYPO|nr:unnamed protein product [Clonostachys byssicola]
MANSSKEEVTSHQHAEIPSSHSVSIQEHETLGCETDFQHLPKGYYYSRFFLGSLLATGLGLWAAVASFGYAAPILTQINADLGPDARYTWISLVYNAALAIFLAPLGRLTDIFGRRYFFIGGGLIGVAGSIVCATSTSIPMLIGGNVLLGICSATQMGFHFVLGELIPLKWRYVGNAFLYLFTIPSGLAPSIDYGFMQSYPNVGWRGLYWQILALNGAALICWVLFYFPPSFEKKHRNEENSSVLYWLKNFDWVGFFLLASGFCVFLLGLSWGGAVYPWKSAATISSIVIGFVVLVAFVLWEIYAPLKEPLIPMHLFKNTQWVVSCVLLGLGAGVYYAFAIIWPMQCATLYNDRDLTYLGGISSLVGVGIISGQIVGGVLTAKIGKAKYQCMTVFTIGGIFLAAVTVSNPDNKSTAIALMFLGCFFIGWNETITLANTTICVEDQREIGIAGGLGASIRAAICAVLVAIYTTILSNRLTQTTSSLVPPALIDAGLPAGSVSDFLTIISTSGTSAPSSVYASVSGITDNIVAAGVRAYKVANSDAYRTVYLSTIAFSGLAIILTFFAPNTEKYMTDHVAATLNQEGTTTDEEKGGSR